MRRSSGAGAPCRRRAIQVLVAVSLAYALAVLLLESPLVPTSLPGAGASAAASRKLHLDGAWEGAGRAAPARPAKHPHRDPLGGRGAWTGAPVGGIVSSLELRHLNSTRSGSLRKVAAEAAESGARVFSDLEALATALASSLDSSGEEEKSRSGRVGYPWRALGCCTGAPASGAAASSLLSCHARSGSPRDVLDAFQRIRCSIGGTPDQFGLAVVLSACSGRGALEHGRQVHCDVLKSGFCSSAFCQAGLVDMYAKVDACTPRRPAEPDPLAVVYERKEEGQNEIETILWVLIQKC